jgi:hypothetical protein
VPFIQAELAKAITNAAIRKDSIFSFGKKKAQSEQVCDKEVDESLSALVDYLNQYVVPLLCRRFIFQGWAHL